MLGQVWTMIDAHCHLYSDKYTHDIDAVIKRAREVLESVVISAVDAESLWKSITLRRQHPEFLYVTGGVHPRHAAQLGEAELAQLWRNIERAKEELVAVGEVGPDFHRVKDSRLRQRQLLVLESAMTRAEAMGLPLVIHARNAEAAALEVVSSSRTPVLFHCFNGSPHMAKRITRRGFYLSFSATLLFNEQVRKAAIQVDQDLILTETDSPALSPRRGRPRNEPAFLKMVVSHLAKLLGIHPTEIGAITSANAKRFYRLSSQPCA
ncbi:MAG: TatD family hydrolase [Deltaproteobacteria bacterium]|nr:MAG: TatD family hydrolase [Deltaproteobacteria bacterium]